ncbi:MAG TPA: hypothetical protein EYQ31_09825, partial [Candidatus Handelsmanbacteria bacterium]|nr:hypothetical protein [Candidatus Handelsmanbacteria bacterium]
MLFLQALEGQSDTEEHGHGDKGGGKQILPEDLGIEQAIQRIAKKKMQQITTRLGDRYPGQGCAEHFEEDEGHQQPSAR